MEGLLDRRKNPAQRNLTPAAEQKWRHLRT